MRLLENTRDYSPGLLVNDAIDFGAFFVLFKVINLFRGHDGMKEDLKRLLTLLKNTLPDDRLLPEGYANRRIDQIFKSGNPSEMVGWIHLNGDIAPQSQVEI
jgi:hypothetical protein